MAVFSQTSLDNLATADDKLQTVAKDIILITDCKVLDGVRTIAEQRKNVERGVSKTMNSRHLPDPVTGKSKAIDIAIYPVNWNDPTPARMSQWEADQLFFAGFFIGYARGKYGLVLRYGGDWNGDMRQLGTGFRDLPHIEIPE